MATSAVLPTLPANPSLLRRVWIGLQALVVLKDDPSNPEAGAMINDCFDLEAYAKLIPYIQETGAGRTMLVTRPSLQGEELSLSSLERLPPGSLGHALAGYYRANGISPFLTTQSVQSDVDYISKRYRETHDIYHLVTGYGTDVMGEMELQAFAMGNLGIRSPLLIVPFGFIGTKLPARFVGASTETVRVSVRTYLRKVRTAYRRGARAQPLIRVPFEEHWETPLDALRERLIDGAVSRAA